MSLGTLPSAEAKYRSPRPAALVRHNSVGGTAGNPLPGHPSVAASQPAQLQTPFLYRVGKAKGPEKRPEFGKMRRKDFASGPGAGNFGSQDLVNPPKAGGFSVSSSPFGAQAGTVPILDIVWISNNK